MAAVDYDDIMIPFLARLIKQLKETPTPEEVEYMKKVDVKEMSIFFDKGSQGAGDREVYDAVLDHIHGRQRKEREVEDARTAIIQAERKAEEERLAAIKAKEDARLAKIEAEKQSKVDAERAIAQAKAVAEQAEVDAAKAKSDAVEAARLAAEKEDAELAARCPGRCDHCKKWIEDKEYLSNEGIFLHNACLDDYQNATSPECTQCGKPMTGEYVNLKSAVSGEVAQCHEECVLDWKKATRPACKHCGEQILEGGLMKSGDDYYHAECAEKAQAAAGH